MSEDTLIADVVDLVNARCLDTTSFSTALSRGLRTVEAAIDIFGLRNIAVSFNGGKDATLVLHLLLIVLQKRGLLRSREKMPVTCLYFAEQDAFPVVDSFVVDMEKRFCLDIIRYDTSFKDGLTAFIEKYQTKAILMGTRRMDPHGHNLEHFTPTTAGWPSVMRVHPVLEWTYSDVWEFLRGFTLPYCDIYDRGFTSVGGRTNSAPNPALRNEDGSHKPAYMLLDEKAERKGRGKTTSQGVGSGGVGTGDEVPSTIGVVVLSSPSSDVQGKLNLDSAFWIDILSTFSRQIIASASDLIRCVAIPGDAVDDAAKEIQTLASNCTYVFVVGSKSNLIVGKALCLDMVAMESFDDALTRCGVDRTSGEVTQVPRGSVLVTGSTPDTTPFVRVSNVLMLLHVSPRWERDICDAVANHCIPPGHACARITLQMNEAAVAPLQTACVAMGARCGVFNATHCLCPDVVLAVHGPPDVVTQAVGHVQAVVPGHSLTTVECHFGDGHDSGDGAVVNDLCKIVQSSATAADSVVSVAQGLQITDVRAVVFMGVSGCGKTLVGREFASSSMKLQTVLGWSAFTGDVRFHDGDEFHSKENIAKMSSGTPLTDDDRAVWLQKIQETIRDDVANGNVPVIACSALKRSYRDVLRCATEGHVLFIHLDGNIRLIESRLKERSEHFMPMSLLQSQFEALEHPKITGEVNHDVMCVEIDRPSHEITSVVKQVLQRLSQSSVSNPS